MKEVLAPMPGKIIDINVKVGDKIEKDQVLIVLEAMKMENEIFAEEAGTIVSIDVNIDETVMTGQKLIEIN